MKRSLLILLSIIFTITLTSCEPDNDYFYEDYTPPAPPTGIKVVNGDDRVDIYWTQNRENDVAGYNVYYNFTYDGKYTLIGSTQYPEFVDFDAVNGNTYYYAVTAYDYNGNESELSYDVIYSTPRPEGFNRSIFDYRRFPNNSGYSFSNYAVVPYDDDRTDFFFENYQGTFYLDVWDDTDIQDVGPTQSIYDVSYAPLDGWSPTKDAIAIPGHTYVIWTWDNHFAKIRISSITQDRITFDWAYQLVEGEPQLKPSLKGGTRGQLERNNVDR